MSLIDIVRITYITSEWNWAAADGSVSFFTCICPFRIMCTTSMPDKMMRAPRKSLKSNIGFAIRLMAR